MKNVFEAAKSVDIKEVFVDMCQGVLPQRRKNAMTVCPFCDHGHKTPCFGFYGKDKNSYTKFKCFSCGEQGDSVSLVKKYYGFASDVDAAKEICLHYNIQYEETGVELSEAYKKYVAVYNYVADIFHTCYKTNYNPDKNYFQNRGLSDETIQKYTLGYCPKVFIKTDNTVLNLRDVIVIYGKFSPADIPAGLVNNDGDCIFSERYIFPIRNTRGDVIAFSGRSLNPNVAKYINTCETDFFKKSSSLFNYNVARAYSTIYVVEGYMDALSLIECGIPNVVAAMGTAFTDTHLVALKGKNIVLSLDHDGAGMTHIYNIIMNYRNIYFRVMYTPEEYKDFNEMLIAKQDIKAYLQRYRLKTGPEFCIRLLTHTQDMSNLDVRSDIWRKLATLIGADFVSYRKEYPINTLYTPVEIGYYWKLYYRFLKKKGVKKDDKTSS